MGADMLVAIAVQPWAHVKQDHPVTGEQINAGAHRRLANRVWTQTDLEELLFQLGLEDDMADMELGDDPSTEAWITAATGLVFRYLDPWLDTLIKGSREVTDYLIGDNWAWVTGGMSWGDTPTDCFDALAAFANYGIFDEALTDEELGIETEPCGNVYDAEGNLRGECIIDRPSVETDHAGDHDLGSPIV